MTAARPPNPTPEPARRQLLQHAAAAVAGGMLLLRSSPASATAEALQSAIRSFTGGVAPRTGRVKLTIAELVENGHAVPTSISVESPMTAESHVQRIGLFNERNPLPEVGIFELSPANGRAQIDTRIRLATTQSVVAIAQMNDGSFWQHRVDVVVTLAACIEGG